MSVSRVVKAGNRIVFDEEGSYTEDKTSGENVNVVADGRMYMLKMWIKNDGRSF